MHRCRWYVLTLSFPRLVNFKLVGVYSKSTPESNVVPEHIVFSCQQFFLYMQRHNWLGNVSCENDLHPANLKICVRPVGLDTNGQISCSVSTILRFAENPLMSILFLSRPYSIGHQYRTSRSPSSPPLSSPFPISDRAGEHHGYGAPPSLVQHARSRAR
jgi:hypothetical protein